MGVSFFGSRKKMGKLALPKNWPQLVEKYKNLVPIYARY